MTNGKHTSYPGGDLVVIHQKTEGFFIRIAYPYAGIDFDVVHALEHIVLRSFLAQYEGDPLFQHFVLNMNGVTLGTMLCIYNCFHKTKALECTQFVLNFLDHTIDFSQDSLSKELDIIGVEDSKTPRHILLLSQIDKFFDADFFRDQKNKITDSVLIGPYNKIIKNNKPIIIIQGDYDDPSIQKAVEYTALTLGNKSAQNRSFSLLDISYVPQIEHFQFTESPKSVVIYMSGTIKSINSVSLNSFLVQFVEESLLQFLRFENSEAYDVERMPRVTAYGRHMAWNFSSKYSSDELLHLVENMFFKDEQDFKLLKEKIYYDTLLWQDDEHRAFYYPTQTLILHNTFQSIPKIAESLKNLTFTEFQNYYYKCLETMSMELTNL